MTTRNLSRWTLAATLALVAVGGFTRGSGSGYGCADRWPLCQDGLLGGLLPRVEFHMIVEWSHRWLAALVGLLAISTAVVAWRGVERWIAWVAVSAVLVIGFQGWVGRLIVVSNLDADLVSLHLAISMTVAALLTVVVVATTPNFAARRDRNWAYRSGVGAVVVFAVLLLGSLVHNIYIPGWPLVSNELFPDLSNRYVALHYLHRLVAAGGFFYLLWLAVGAGRAQRPSLERGLLWIALGAFAVNVGLGAANVFTQVTWSGLIAAHLGAASIVWVSLVGAAASAAGLGARPTPN